MKKILLLFYLSILPILTSCNTKKEDIKIKNENNNIKNEDVSQKKELKEKEQFEKLKVGMVTDIAGINDQSFNQSGYEGLMRLQDTTKAKVSYIESRQRSHFGDNLQKLTDDGHDIVWGMGILFVDDIKEAALKNPEQVYGIVDYDFNKEVPKNVVSLIFKDNESAFLIGYIAGKTTKTNKVGFIGGMRCGTLDRFEYGYRAGVDYASKELNKEIEVSVEYINTFTDDSLAKAKALVLYGNKIDIIYAATGPSSLGIIEAAKDLNKLVCGVDKDQSSIAPDNVMISSIKCIGDCMSDISKKLYLGEDVKSKVLYYGLKENGVAISKYEGSTAKLIDKEIYDDAIKVSDLIKKGEIFVPENESQMEKYLNTIK